MVNKLCEFVRGILVPFIEPLRGLLRGPLYPISEGVRERNDLLFRLAPVLLEFLKCFVYDLLAADVTFLASVIGFFFFVFLRCLLVPLIIGPLKKIVCVHASCEKRRALPLISLLRAISFAIFSSVLLSILLSVYGGGEKGGGDCGELRKEMWFF